VKQHPDLRAASLSLLCNALQAARAATVTALSQERHHVISRSFGVGPEVPRVKWLHPIASSPDPDGPTILLYALHGFSHCWADCRGRCRDVQDRKVGVRIFSLPSCSIASVVGVSVSVSFCHCGCCLRDLKAVWYKRLRPPPPSLIAFLPLRLIATRLFHRLKTSCHHVHDEQEQVVPGELWIQGWKSNAEEKGLIVQREGSQSVKTILSPATTTIIATKPGHFVIITNLTVSPRPHPYSPFHISNHYLPHQ
jgi:hypothetical protein